MMTWYITKEKGRASNWGWIHKDAKRISPHEKRVATVKAVSPGLAVAKWYRRSHPDALAISVSVMAILPDGYNWQVEAD